MFKFKLTHHFYAVLSRLRSHPSCVILKFVKCRRAQARRALTFERPELEKKAGAVPLLRGGRGGDLKTVAHRDLISATKCCLKYFMVCFHHGVPLESIPCRRLS
jgi:hypothetical protein